MHPGYVVFLNKSFDHVDRKRNSILLDHLIVMLMAQLSVGLPGQQYARTLIGSSSARMEGGTIVPQSFVMRLNDENVWMGMMPGIMGTLIP